MAAAAQQLQAQGMGVQACQFMTIARSTMREAMDMKGAAESLHAANQQELVAEMAMSPSASGSERSGRAS
eukprot:10176674-Heterocapsa_arctica.AAC.1